MSDELFIFIIISILIIYPGIISFIIAKKHKYQRNLDNSDNVLESIGFLMLYAVIIFFLSLIFFENYESFISSIKENCSNTSTFASSCIISNVKPVIYMIIMDIIILLHHYLSIINIYAIFENSKIFRVVFMYIHFILLYIYSIFIFLSIFGFMITYTYNPNIINIIGYITVFLPICLFLVTPFIKKSKY